LEKNIIVSIITPCYNAEEFIDETIISVLNQSYHSIQYIVVDDGSTDNSLKILNTYKNNITLVKGAHKGACAARNRGAEIAKGDYLLFLDADDILETNTIEVFLSEINGKPNTLVACNWKRLNYVDDKWISGLSGLSKMPPNNDFIKGWLSGWYVPPVGVLWTKYLYDKTGGWDESLAANQDGDLILRALISGVNIHLVNNTSVFYRHHASNKISISSSKSSRHLKSRMKVLKKVIGLLDEKKILDNYKIDIGKSYHSLARNNFKTNIKFARLCELKAKEYAGKYRFSGSKTHVYLSRIFGLEKKEKLAEVLSGFGFKKTKRKKSESIIELLKNE
jgi:O-antigen biosynthesis protein